MNQSVRHSLFKYINENAVQLCLDLYIMAFWRGVRIEPWAGSFFARKGSISKTILSYSLSPCFQLDSLLNLNFGDQKDFYWFISTIQSSSVRVFLPILSTVQHINPAINFVWLMLTSLTDSCMVFCCQRQRFRWLMDNACIENVF